MIKKNNRLTINFPIQDNCTTSKIISGNQLDSVLTEPVDCISLEDTNRDDQVGYAS